MSSKMVTRTTYSFHKLMTFSNFQMVSIIFIAGRVIMAIGKDKIIKEKITTIILAVDNNNSYKIIIAIGGLKMRAKIISYQTMGWVRHKCKDFILIVIAALNSSAQFAFYRSQQMTNRCFYIAFINFTPIASNHGLKNHLNVQYVVKTCEKIFEPI